MKSTTLKIVTNEQTTTTAVAAKIRDTLPPPIHAVAQEPMPPRIVRRLDVDGVLARSLPKTLAESPPLHKVTDSLANLTKSAVGEATEDRLNAGRNSDT